jgi:hypothetical protein
LAIFLMRSTAIRSVFLILFAGWVLARSQATPQRGALADANSLAMAENYFKNVQVLRGIPVDEFMNTMGMFAAATGMNCVDCHVPEAGGDWARYADDNDYKRTTRMMVLMVDSLNRTSFGGRRVVTCFTCHRGLKTPAVIPSLDLQYGEPPPVDPDEITQNDLGAPPIDEILDKYLQALGGTERLTGVTSIAGKGTYRAYDDFETFPLDYYATAPNQSSTIQHSADGDLTIAYDGRNAWMAAPKDMRPYTLVALSGGNREGAAIDAILAFPGWIKQSLTTWRVGPLSSIGDQEVQIVQASTPTGFPVKLYFDVETGFLLRSERYADTPVGKVPTRTDYSDYRIVSGIKMPFRWISTWTDGQTVFQLDTVQLNAPVDPAKFTKPIPPAP